MPIITRNPDELADSSFESASKWAPIRRPDELIVGKIYTFIRDINGFKYKRLFTGTTESHITGQESQWTGSKGPLDKIYEFIDTYPNGHSSKTWLWAHTLKDGLCTDGVWLRRAVRRQLPTCETSR
jgi:hypothetical protein